MGGVVSYKGELIKVKVHSSYVSLTNVSSHPLIARVYKRTCTIEQRNAKETFKVEYHLRPGEKARGDNDYEITEQGALDRYNGVDYYIRVLPDVVGCSNARGEVVQIVQDGTYRFYPNVKLVEDAWDWQTRAPLNLARAMSGRFIGIQAKLKTLVDELCETRKALGILSNDQDQLREQVLKELYALSEPGDIFEDALSELFDSDCEKKDSQLDAALDIIHETALIRDPDDWWEEADVGSLGLAVSSRVKDCRLMSVPSQSPMPWSQGQSEKLYEEMGMEDPSKIHLAVWMVLGRALVLTVSEVVDNIKFQEMMKDGEMACLEKRFKLVLTPIHLSSSCRSVVPAWATDPAQARFVKQFLGTKGSWFHCARLPSGVEHVSLAIDFNRAGPVASWAIKNVGFREGHVLDLHCVDSRTSALFASVRLVVTKEVRSFI